MSNKKNIIFTGGGSGGHVMPATTLIRKLDSNQYNVFYIGSRKGIERDLISSLNLPYFPIFTGKLRRYLSFENFLDLFRLSIGFLQAFILLFRFRRRDSLIFSTGGFVSVPVVIAAWLQGKTIYIHEQTSRVGLANKICSYFADKIFISFEESSNFFPESKTIFSGYPLRDECYNSDVARVEYDGIVLNDVDRPIIFITGGGNGALIINDKIKSVLEKLQEKFFVVHQVGKNFIEEYKQYKGERYLPLAFVSDNMIDLYKLAKVVISRAGAGTVSELLALRKRTIFIPLKIAQKNEQYHNAMEAKNKISSMVIKEDEFIDSNLMTVLDMFLNEEPGLLNDDNNRAQPEASKTILLHISNFYN